MINLEDKSKKEKKKIKWKKIIGYIILISIIAGIVFNKIEESKINELSVTEFEEKIESKDAKKIKEITLYDNVGLISYEVKGEKYEVKIPKNYIQENSDLIKTMKEKEIKLSVKNQSNWLQTAANASRILLTVFILYFLFKFIEDFNRKLEVEEVKGNKITFADVAGAESVKTEFQDIIEYYKDPEKNASFKEDLPSGILLEGPPGNGKTHIARALAGECNIPFFQKSASDLEGKYVGVGSENIGNLFETVRKKAAEAGGAILFLDELDSIAVKREVRTVVETNQTINKFLTEMDGFVKDSNVIVVAATNLVSSLDEAVIRPGRFDRIIHIGKPTTVERVEVLNLYLNKKKDKIEAEVYEEKFVETLAKITEGFSNAKLANLVKESSVMARRKGKDTIGIQELREGFTKIIAGVKRKEVLSEEDRKIVAFHEAGHAVAQIVTSPLKIKGVAYITITPYGQSLGHVSPVAPDTKLERKSQLENIVVMTLAGRAVEDKILNGDYTIGASNDLYQANEVILEYIAKYGMSSSEKNLYIHKIDANNEMLQTEVKKMREEMYRKTKELVEKHFDMIEKIALHLLENESIEQYEIEEIVQECPSYLEV